MTQRPRAKALRAARRAEGVAISHAEALELVAHAHGAKDWNTLHARLALRNTPPPLTLGYLACGGRYLGQAFTGRIIGLSGPVSRREIEIRFRRTGRCRHVRKLFEPAQASQGDD